MPTFAPLTLPSGQARGIVMPLSGGDTGTAETIGVIRQLIDSGMKDPDVNRTAIAIVQAARVKPYDTVGEYRAIYDWVLKNIRFTRDIAGKETLRTAREILTVRAGDCDDKTILLAALLSSIGHRVRLVTVKANALAPDLFSHIYPEVYSRGRWIALDAARRDPALGKSPTRYFQKRVWSIASDDFQDVQGLHGMGQFDWSGAGQFATGISTDVSNIIRAIKTPSFSPYGYGQPGYPPGYAAPGGGVLQQPVYGGGSFQMNTQTMLLIGGGLLVLILAMSRR